MAFFGSSHSSTRGRRSWFHRTSPDRRAGGLKASLANPNTTRQGRHNAERELHAMGRSSHVSFMTKVKRTLGIRSSPRRRTAAHHNRGIL
ncbi:hypothetical protein C8R47DRAFT_787828 [Mycena vitilis]|nr:hypothetical protein C8R47DRAFT_787828 [Mycena vitilis]